MATLAQIADLREDEDFGRRVRAALSRLGTKIATGDFDVGGATNARNWTLETIGSPQAVALRATYVLTGIASIQTSYLSDGADQANITDGEIELALTSILNLLFGGS